MVSENSPLTSQSQTPVEVVCCGTLSVIKQIVVDQWPERNTGCYCKEQKDLIAADAAMVARILRGWDVKSGIIGSSLGEDYIGRWVVEEFKRLGILTEVGLTNQYPSGVSVLVSDSTGARTGFWPSPELEQQVIHSLATADLSLLKDSRLLYVDWYDQDAILRPMDEARQLGIPVFLNLESGHEDSGILSNFAGRATFCQAVTDAAQRGDESPFAVAKKLLDAGAETAIITLASEGCLVVNSQEMIRVFAPSIEVVDSLGAGATFSSGFMYGYLQGWNLEESTRFATAAASIKCTYAGLKTPNINECKQLAASLKVDYPTGE
jgi:ribokinase